MKLSKILALILALACFVSILASCDMEGEGNNNTFDPSKTPETPKEYYDYAYNYMMSHPYKQTTVSSATFEGETSTDTSVCHMDGINYYLVEDGMTAIFYDSTIYVQSAAGKKKMDIDLEAAGEDFGFTDDYFAQVGNSLTDDNIKLTKNADGTTTLEFSINLIALGLTDYVMTLDKDNRVVRYVISNEMTVMGYTGTTVDDSTVEYGDQYKVSPPADADDYEVVDSYYDLVM